MPELSSGVIRSTGRSPSHLPVIAETTLGALASLGAAMAWAVTSLLARSLMPELNAATVNAVRSTIGGAILVVWVLTTAGLGAFTTISGGAWILLTLSIVIAIAIGDTVFFESSRALGLGRAMTISTTYPVGAAAIAAVFLGEPVTLPIALGTLVTLAGLVLIVAPWAERAPEERFWFGVGTAAIASLAWAVSTVLVTVGGFVLLPGVSACIGHVIFTPQAVQAIGAISVAVGKWLKTALDSTTKTAIRSSGKGGVENVDDGKCCCTQVCKRLPLRGPPGTLQ